MLPTSSSPWSPRSEDARYQDRQCHDDEGARHQRRPPAQCQEQREAGQPHSEGEPAGLVEVGDQGPQLLEEVALALLDAEQLRELTDEDRQGQADDEALEHRLGDHRGQEPQPQQARREGDDPGDQGERGREGDVVARVVRERCDDPRRQRGGGRHRGDDQVARAAEQRVEHQRGSGGVQTDHGWGPSDAGVGERLGHEHGPNREAGDNVGTRPAAVIPGEGDQQHPRHPADARTVLRPVASPDSGEGRGGPRAYREPAPQEVKRWDKRSVRSSRLPSESPSRRCPSSRSS